MGLAAFWLCNVFIWITCGVFCYAVNKVVTGILRCIQELYERVERLEKKDE